MFSELASDAPSQDKLAPEQRLLVAIFETAITDAQAGDAQAIAFLTDDCGVHAEARRSWLAFFDLDDELIRQECALRFSDAPKLRPCRPGSRPAQVVDLLVQGPKSLGELAAALGCTRERAGITVDDVRKKGYIVQLDRSSRFVLTLP